MQLLQNRRYPLAQVQVGVTDDGRRGTAAAINSAGAGRRQALGELHLSDRAHLLRPFSAVHGSGLNKDGGPDVVAAIQVGQQLVKQIPLVGQAGRP